MTCHDADIVVRQHHAVALEHEPEDIRRVDVLHRGDGPEAKGRREESTGLLHRRFTVDAASDDELHRVCSQAVGTDVMESVSAPS